MISNITRYQDVWSEYFSKYNTLNFGIPGDKIQHVIMEGKEPEISLEFNFILYLYFICGFLQIFEVP